MLIVLLLVINALFSPFQRLIAQINWLCVISFARRLNKNLYSEIILTIALTNEI